jgi:hypothetical protein
MFKDMSENQKTGSKNSISLNSKNEEDQQFLGSSGLTD